MKVTAELREQIRILTIRGFTPTRIAEKIFPKPLNYLNYVSLVEYHYNKVKKSIEFTTKKDIIDTFDVEYSSVRQSFEFRKARLEERLDKASQEDDNKMIMQLETLIHQIDVDRWKLIGDNELVLAVRRLKDERASQQQDQRGTVREEQKPRTVSTMVQS